MVEVCPSHSSANGFVERKNNTLVEMVRCLLQDKDLSMNFWAEAICLTNYLLKRVPMKVVCQVTIVKKWPSKKPSIGHLRTFVCLALAHILDYCRKKLDANSQAYIMMGYSKDSKSY